MWIGGSVSQNQFEAYFLPRCQPRDSALQLPDQLRIEQDHQTLFQESANFGSAARSLASSSMALMVTGRSSETPNSRLRCTL